MAIDYLPLLIMVVIASIFATIVMIIPVIVYASRIQETDIPLKVATIIAVRDHI